MRGVSPADEDGESEGEVDDDMECEDTQLMEPRMMYSTDSDSNTDKEEKLSWNEDSESGSETENRVRTSHAESYTWATVASEPSSDNTSPVDNRDRDRFSPMTSAVVAVSAFIRLISALRELVTLQEAAGAVKALSCHRRLQKAEKLCKQTPSLPLSLSFYDYL